MSKNITNAKYVDQTDSGTNEIIKATINDIEMFIPLTSGNRHYREIMRQVEAGELTIADAD